MRTRRRNCKKWPKIGHNKKKTKRKGRVWAWHWERTFDNEQISYNSCCYLKTVLHAIKTTLGITCTKLSFSAFVLFDLNEPKSQKLFCISLVISGKTMALNEKWNCNEEYCLLNEGLNETIENSGKCRHNKHFEWVNIVPISIMRTNLLHRYVLLSFYAKQKWILKS